MAARSKPINKRRYRIDRRAHYQFLLPLLVVAAGLVAYHNSFSGAFVLDDRRTIVTNERIHELWRPERFILGSRRPTADLSLAVNYALDGLDVRGYHAFNLTVHLLAALTLLGVVRRTLLTEPLQARYAGAAPWLALTVALIWVTHSLGTQSVTYIIQRCESLMGLFYLLTLYCVIRSVDSPRRGRWHCAAVCCCVLGMGSKAVMVTAPVVVLMYDRVFIAGTFGQAVRRRWGLYLALASTWGVLAACGIIRGVFSAAGPGATVGFGFKGITPLEYALTQPGVILRYLALSFWPTSLSLDYAWTVARTIWEAAVPGCAVLALLGATGWALLRRPRVGFVGFWFFAILAPTSSFIPIRDPIFEHRMYLPLAAVVVLTVMTCHAALKYVGSRLPLANRRGRMIAIGLTVTVVTTMALVTVRRNRDYRSELAMWADVVEKQPHNWRARSDLGLVLAAAGRQTEAIAQYREALRLRPDSFGARYNLGNVLLRMGKPDQAIDHYAEAVRLKPDHVEAHINWANALVEQDRIEQAIARFEAALAIRPLRAERGVLIGAHINLGNALFGRSEFDPAITHYREALRLKPGHFRTHYNLGLALKQQHKINEAIAEFQETLRLKPNHAGARRQLDNLADHP